MADAARLRRPHQKSAALGGLEIHHAKSSASQILRLFVNERGTGIQVTPGQTLLVQETDATGASMGVHALLADQVSAGTIYATGDITTDGNLVVTDVSHCDLYVADDAVIGDTCTLQGRHAAGFNAETEEHEGSLILEPNTQIPTHEIAPVGLAFGSTNATHDGVYLTLDPSLGAGRSVFTLRSRGTDLSISPSGKLEIASGDVLSLVDPDIGDATGGSLSLTGDVRTSSVYAQTRLEAPEIRCTGTLYLPHDGYLRSIGEIGSRDILRWLTSDNALHVGTTGYNAYLEGGNLYLTSLGDLVLHPGPAKEITTNGNGINLGEGGLNAGPITGTSLSLSGAISAASISVQGGVEAAAFMGGSLHVDGALEGGFITGLGLSVGPGSIQGGEIQGVSLNLPEGPIWAGEITCTSVNAASLVGTNVQADALTANALTCTSVAADAINTTSLNATSYQTNGTALNLGHLPRWDGNLGNPTNLFGSVKANYYAVHGLGQVPTLFGAYVVCLQAEGDFVPGDRIQLATGSNAGGGFLQIWAETYVVALTKSSTNALLLNSRSASTTFTPTGSKWDLHLWAWRS